MLKEFDMELLERLSKGYLRARKKERSAILTQYQDITGLKRQTIKKIYEPPKTPFQRLIENKTIPGSIKEDLRRTMKDLNIKNRDGCTYDEAYDDKNKSQ